jgi:hypothetical protein
MFSFNAYKPIAVLYLPDIFDSNVLVPNAEFALP